LREAALEEFLEDDLEDDLEVLTVLDEVLLPEGEMPLLLDVRAMVGGEFV
jgi:hypothetical protein